MSITELAKKLALQNWSATLLKKAKRYEERAKAHWEQDSTDPIRQRIKQNAVQWRQECEIVDDWTHGRNGRPGPNGPVW